MRPIATKLAGLLHPYLVGSRPCYSPVTRKAPGYDTYRKMLRLLCQPSLTLQKEIFLRQFHLPGTQKRSAAKHNLAPCNTCYDTPFNLSHNSI